LQQPRHLRLSVEVKGCGRRNILADMNTKNARVSQQKDFFIGDIIADEDGAGEAELVHGGDQRFTFGQGFLGEEVDHVFAADPFRLGGELGDGGIDALEGGIGIAGPAVMEGDRGALVLDVNPLNASEFAAQLF